MNYTPITFPVELLTLHGIAEVHHSTLRHTRDVIVKISGFPSEAPTSTPRNRLWLAHEVYGFVGRIPANIPQNG